MARLVFASFLAWALLWRAVSAIPVNVTVHYADLDEYAALRPSHSRASSVLTLNFNGTAIYIYSSPDTTSPTRLQFSLDDFPAQSIDLSGSSDTRDYCVFAQSSLPDVGHTLLIKTTSEDTPTPLFNYALYTVEDSAFVFSITPNADEDIEFYAPQSTLLSNRGRILSRSIHAPNFTIGLWLAIFIPAGLIVLLAVACLTLLYIRRKRRLANTIDPFVIVSPIPTTPLPTRSPAASGFSSAPSSAMPILRKFDFEQFPDNGSILESVVSMSLAVTPLPSEVEEIYSQLEVLSVAVESLHRRDSSVYTSRPESIRRRSQETRRIQTDVENLRLDINRLKLGSTLGHSNHGHATTAGNSSASVADTLSLAHRASVTSSTIPLNRLYQLQNMARAVADSHRDPGEIEQPATNDANNAEKSAAALGPMELLRDLAMLRSEIDELLAHVQDVHGNGSVISTIERLPSYSSRTHSRRPSRGREMEEVPPLPPLPPQMYYPASPVQSVPSVPHIPPVPPPPSMPAPPRALPPLPRRTS